MNSFIYPFSFTEDDASQVRGSLELEEPLPYRHPRQGSGFYRQGKIVLEDGHQLDLVLYHSQATEAFIYLRKAPPDRNLLEIIGLNPPEIYPLPDILLPGQLCLGAERVHRVGLAIRDVIGSPVLRPTFANHHQQNIAVFPIVREGLKYQVSEAIFDEYGNYCDEIVLDAHHVFDQSVPIYNRKVEMTLFKDKDFDQVRRENIHVAFVADSIASGLVMKEVIARIRDRFDHLRQVEVIAPLATIRGLCRLARAETTRDLPIRLHVFETLLNALPPDYYYSAHYNIAQLHFDPRLEEAYRAWWGQDDAGRWIADTACAGYGWSEVFFSPRKQIEMINAELGTRHGLTIADLVKRRIAQSLAVQS